MSRSERIAQQLGMSHGAAAGRLRKKILFSLLVRLKENICFKCTKAIDAEEDLSIEHKQPWENRNPELFWDLSNIAFSHTSCNRPHRFATENLKEHAKPIVAPDGMAWCGKHKQFLSADLFYKNQSKANGFSSYCKLCHDDHQGHGVVWGRVSKFQ